METEQSRFQEKLLRNNVICAFSNKSHGNMSFKRGPEKDVVENRKQFLKTLGIDLRDVVAMQEVHGKDIYVVNNNDKSKGAFSKKNWIENIDGLLTKQKGLFLFGTFADCLPIFFFNPKQKVVGLAHAGWRGVVSNICQAMILKMQKIFQCSPQDTLIKIGPSIKSCCFEIQEDISSEFRNYQNAVIRQNSKIFANLQKICYEQLTENKIAPKNIDISKICTYCEKEIYSSHRREGEKAIAMGGVIGIK